MSRHRVTAFILAVLLPATITFLARLHHPVTANRTLRLCVGWKQSRGGRTLLCISRASDNLLQSICLMIKHGGWKEERTCETTLGTASFGVQHGFDGFQGARREFVIVLLIP